MAHEHTLLVADKTDRTEQDQHSGNQEQADPFFDPGVAPGCSVFDLHCVLLGRWPQPAVMGASLLQCVQPAIIDWRATRLTIHCETGSIHPTRPPTARKSLPDAFHDTCLQSMVTACARRYPVRRQSSRPAPDPAPPAVS